MSFVCLAYVFGNSVAYLSGSLERLVALPTPKAKTLGFIIR